MSRERPALRWPDGCLISATVGEGAIALSHCQTADREAVTETIGALLGRPDLARLALRLRELQPRTALFGVAIQPAHEDYDAGISVGAVLGLISAMGIEIE